MNVIVSRALRTVLLTSRKSILLLGPRQVGKSTLMQELLPTLSINLADEVRYLEFARNPARLRELVQAQKPQTVLIDEVQRLPSLLNTAQALIDEKRTRFLLTGSSARKLRRGEANLLPGRVHVYALGPIVHGESPLSDEEVMATGSLPGVLTEANPRDKQKTLRSYAATYLREEIQAEALTRNIEGFARFLDLAAATSGSFLDLSKLAASAMVPRETAVRYFQILEDTMIVRRCEAFAKSDRKRLVQHPRFFFFDCGVLNGTLGNFEVSADRIGTMFEHFVFNQIVHSAAAQDRDIRVTSFRSAAGAEVDFIVELDRKTFAVEVKASAQVGTHDLRGLRAFEQFFGKKCELLVAYRGKDARDMSGVPVLPWPMVLERLGLGTG